jgi:hypothetical protein
MGFCSQARRLYWHSTSYALTNTHFVVPTSSLLFFVLPQRKVTKESGTLAYRSARQSSYTAHNPDSADTAIADRALIKFAPSAKFQSAAVCLLRVPLCGGSAIVE